MGLCTSKHRGQNYISYPPSQNTRLHVLASWGLDHAARIDEDGNIHGECECELAPLAWARYHASQPWWKRCSWGHIAGWLFFGTSMAVILFLYNGMLVAYGDSTGNSTT